jgi:ATP/maltotriose-dependent transcriptional regulator MalT
MGFGPVETERLLKAMETFVERQTSDKAVEAILEDRKNARQAANSMRGEVTIVVGDNKRLRALIKAAQWAAEHHDSEGVCPWCERGSLRKHADTCPAFTPEGEVR